MNNEAQMTVKEVPDRGLAVLRVIGELPFEKRKDFTAAAEQLLACEQQKLVIDLTRVIHLFSVYLGTIGDVHKRAIEAGKTLTVLVTRRIEEMFGQVGLDSVLTLVRVDDQS